MRKATKTLATTLAVSSLLAGGAGLAQATTSVPTPVTKATATGTDNASVAQSPRIWPEWQNGKFYTALSGSRASRIGKSIQCDAYINRFKPNTFPQRVSGFYCLYYDAKVKPKAHIVKIWPHKMYLLPNGHMVWVLTRVDIKDDRTGVIVAAYHPEHYRA